MQAALASLLLVPGPPTGLTAAVSDQAISLTWSAPGWGGAHALTAYGVSVAGQPGLAQTVSSPSAQLTGLTNGTTYAISVVAKNSDGSSAAAQVSAAPATVPAAPTAVSAVATNGRAAVTWTAPTDTGSVPLTGYRVTTRREGPVDRVGDHHHRDRAHQRHGLHVQGPGPEPGRLLALSAASTPVTPQSTAPGAPTGVTAVAGVLGATVSWVAPVDDGGGGP